MELMTPTNLKGANNMSPAIEYLNNFEMVTIMSETKGSNIGFSGRSSLFGHDSIEELLGKILNQQGIKNVATMYTSKALLTYDEFMTYFNNQPSKRKVYIRWYGPTPKEDMKYVSYASWFVGISPMMQAKIKENYDKGFIAFPRKDANAVKDERHFKLLNFVCAIRSAANALPEDVREKFWKTNEKYCEVMIDQADLDWDKFVEFREHYSKRYNL
jgi:hypothetical protein